ncbi:MAG: hypothetical protein JWL69_4461 [Phycisphaerales bacterium]|nr:hypothetical protein [Phycisphaerales bacterium]
MTTAADPIPARSQTTTDAARRLANVAALAAVAILFLAKASPRSTLDLDLFHQMALARAAVHAGAMPIQDVFAYTSHPGPSVHYEWGNGAVAYAVTSAFGAPGLLILKYLLTAFTAALAMRVARQRGATWPVICALSPGAALMMSMGFTTIRAGLFTLFFCALLVALLEGDRRGKRMWVLPWLAAYVAWLNIHPGFIVGAGLMGLYWFERVIRYRKPQWHLIAAGIAMIGLVLVNPYGRLYPAALWHAVTAPLPPIPEWLPIWRCGDWPSIEIYFLTLALAISAVIRAGWRRCEGVFMLIVCAAAAFQHLRHLYLYALVWFCYVPGWLTLSPMGQTITRVWERRPRIVAAACVVVGLVFVPTIVAAKPWALHMPVALNDPDNLKENLLYSGNAVEYLKRIGFHGNVMTDYNDGSYVMWHLWPSVKIGLDSRNDVGYSYDFIMEVVKFYRGVPGWHQTLDRYPTDLVLIKRSYRLADLMASETNWRRVYRDDSFELWARPGLKLPVEDQTGQPLTAKFP